MYEDKYKIVKPRKIVWNNYLVGIHMELNNAVATRKVFPQKP